MKTRYLLGTDALVDFIRVTTNHFNPQFPINHNCGKIYVCLHDIAPHLESILMAIRIIFAVQLEPRKFKIQNCGVHYVLSGA